MILPDRRPFGAIAPSYKFAEHPRPALPRYPSRRYPYRQRLVPVLLLLLLLLTTYSANAQRYAQ